MAHTLIALKSMDWKRIL